MPITSPSGVISGPPELPGLAAASNWMRLVSIRLPSAFWYSRPSPEITPAETDGPMPNGKPTATTGSPGRSPAVERSVAAHEVVGDRFRLQHREIVLGLRADHDGVGLQAVVEHDLDRFRAVHHVQVGEDDAGVDDHHAGAALRLAARGDVGVGGVGQPTDMHHGRQDALVGVGGGRRGLLRFEHLLHHGLDIRDGEPLGGDEQPENQAQQHCHRDAAADLQARRIALAPLAEAKGRPGRRGELGCFPQPAGTAVDRDPFIRSPARFYRSCRGASRSRMACNMTEP